MLLYLFYVITIFLIIVGLLQIFKETILFFYNKNKKSAHTTLIPISGHNENVEFLIRSAIAEARWNGGIKEGKIICLDCGMDEETKKICNILAQSYSFIELHDLKEFDNSLK